MFFILVAALIVAGSGYALYKVSTNQAKLTDGTDGSKQLPRSIADLRVDDVISIDMKDYVVLGVIKYAEDGHRWAAGYVTDGEKDSLLYIGIERVGSSKIRLMSSIDIDVGDYPPSSVIWDKQTFELDKRGTATCELSGTVKDRVTGTGARCRWWLYTDIEGRCVIIEQWGDDFHALGGRNLPDTSVEFLPAS